MSQNIHLKSNSLQSCQTLFSSPNRPLMFQQPQIPKNDFCQQKAFHIFFGRNDSFRSSQSLFRSPSLKMACFLSKSLYASMKNDDHMNMRGSLTHSFEMKEYIFDFVSVFFFFKYLDKSYLKISQWRLYSFILNNAHSFLKIKSPIAKRINISCLVLLK